jgi:hypothetical protein
MPELIKEFEYFLDFDEFYEVGLGPFGERRIFNVAGGQFAGDRLKGTIVGGSDPSLLFGQDGFARIDNHETYETDDGAVIYVQYFGLLELTPGSWTSFVVGPRRRTSASSTSLPTPGWRQATRDTHG